MIYGINFVPAPGRSCWTKNAVAAKMVFILLFSTLSLLKLSYISVVKKRVFVFYCYIFLLIYTNIIAYLWEEKGLRSLIAPLAFRMSAFEAHNFLCLEKYDMNKE